ncbi:aminoglycoside 6'-N-acetyltransferase [Exiguobacterium aestuarii]|uniref:Aminoglycoside N(6')-acetyltransferase type 1 n=1 Tax=Exiguobacterium aestuarii TaxID=273527 RepID=A0ABW2PL81_9BACL|nr:MULTISPECIES: aminoglycoside 6'-N-acetyltransferase [Exiguobacterium]MCT4785617.1 GNAT family N-acetyltransferase [Exiguobacterium aestuarii]
MKVEYATMSNQEALAQLMHELWPDAPIEELRMEVKLGLVSKKMHYFIASSDTKIIGFCQLSFRRDYVPGATTSPTAYVEGLYVLESERNKGVASRLIEAASTFAVNQGCIELASDTELENENSQQFHEKIGFKEVERVVTYMKKLSHET